MNPDQQKSLMREFLSALDRTATDELDALISPDFTFETVSSASGDPSVWDRERFLETIPAALRTMFPEGFHYEFGPAICDGVNGSMQGAAETITAQGKPYINRYHWFFAFDDEKISTFREYLDSFAVYEAFRP